MTEDAHGPAIKKVSIHRLSLPLTQPYRLSLGEQSAFCSVIVCLEDETGATGYGEATLLPGYTDETVDTAFALASKTAQTIVGKTPSGIRAAAEALPRENAFTATAFSTAVDHLTHHATLAASGRVEILAGVNGTLEDRAGLQAEINGLIGKGYRTLKLKVGFDLHADIKFVREVQAMTSGSAKLRVDANQGYTAKQAVQFCSGLHPAGIELVEQTCAAGDWKAALAVRRGCRLPLMLDESIMTVADIREVIRFRCADFIKLKLMKFRSLDALTHALKMIRTAGMTPVLGNGVATDLGCWMEACVAAKVISNASEFNGFTRATDHLLDRPLRQNGAYIMLDGIRRTLDPDKLQRYSVDKAEFGG